MLSDQVLQDDDVVLESEVLALAVLELRDPLLNGLEKLELADAGLRRSDDGGQRFQRQLEELGVLALEDVGEPVLHALEQDRLKSVAVRPPDLSQEPWDHRRVDALRDDLGQECSHVVEVLALFPDLAEELAQIGGSEDGRVGQLGLTSVRQLLHAQV